MGSKNKSELIQDLQSQLEKNEETIKNLQAQIESLEKGQEELKTEAQRVPQLLNELQIAQEKLETMKDEKKEKESSLQEKLYFFKERGLFTIKFREILEGEKARLESALESKQDELDEHINTEGELTFKLSQQEQTM